MGHPDCGSTKEGWNDPNLWGFLNNSEQSYQGGLPKVEDKFAAIEGSALFSKIDLLHAYMYMYLQMELDEGARELSTINTHKGL